MSDEALIKEYRQRVLATITAWRIKDHDAVSAILRDEVYTSTAETVKYVSMLLEVCSFLEELLADALGIPVEESHARLAMLVETDQM